MQFSYPDRLKERQMTFQLLLSKEEQTSLAKHRHPDNLHNTFAPQYIRGDDAPTNAYYHHNNIKYLITINEKNSTPEAVYICLHTKKKGISWYKRLDQEPLWVEIARPSIWQLCGSSKTREWPHLPKTVSSGRGEDDNFEWRLAIERRQLASEKTAESSPLGDRKIERRKRCVTHPSFNIRASSTSAFEGPSSKLKASTRTGINISWDNRSYPGACNVRPHEPRMPMPRAPRPQEPGRSRPPMATTWAPRPDLMATPMVQNVHPHLDPVITPVMRNVHSHPAEQPIGRNIPNGPPIGSISKRLDDMLSTPFCSHIINYEPPRGFLVPKFSTYDGTNDPFDHIMHYRQLMTVDIGNDALLCKVFPASLQGQALSWFHRLPPNSVDNFRDLSEAFVGQYLCFARHKQNISTLQNIKMQDNESLREFVKRFGQVVLQVEACSMDAVLQIFKQSICPGTPFFESLAKKPPTTMNDLFRRANKYSMLEDDEGPSRPEMPPLTHLSISYEKLLPMIQDLSDFKWPRPIGTDPSTRIVAGDVPSQRSWPYNRDMPIFPVSGRKAHKSRALKQYLRSDNGRRDAPQLPPRPL
ncbi:hypothetical protein CK203_097140 [Vitis vinifera]|uniref:Retrotransposon gag domain-containing protein n=1 Tax=Vitis vinifera TaxID=29760 RepID=A0A438CG53_VITVI|nr:hypothetical protein CK203_097140 [Vitis vinifera]